MNRGFEYNTPPPVASADPRDVFDRYAPPFDLTSDFLFAFCLAPTRALAQAFPYLPFISVAERTPLVAWFGRVRQIGYTDSTGQRQKMGNLETVLYDELNVAPLLGARRLFVSDIYSNSPLAVQIGLAYGMSKTLTSMSLQQTPTTFSATVATSRCGSDISAERLIRSKSLHHLSRYVLPRSLWKTHFPASTSTTPTLHPLVEPSWYRIRQGTLNLQASWLPTQLAFFPLALYLRHQKMQLPPL